MTIQEIFSFEDVCRIVDDATEKTYGVRPYKTLPESYQDETETLIDDAVERGALSEKKAERLIADGLAEDWVARHYDRI